MRTKLTPLVGRGAWGVRRGAPGAGRGARGESQRAGSDQVTLNAKRGTSRPTPHASRLTPHAPMTLGGQPRFPGANGGDPAAAGDLRLGHAWRRASIPLHGRLTTLWSATGGVLSVGTPRCSDLGQSNLRNICSDICRCEFRAKSQQISTFYEPSVQAMETRLERAAATAAPDGSPRSYPRPTPTAASGQ